MMLRMNLREATRSLLATKQRTLLALLGITIGIASVIAMVSVGAIVQNEALSQFIELGTDILRITNLSNGSEKRGEGFVLKAAHALKNSCPDLKIVCPYNLNYNGKIKYLSKTWPIKVLGITGDFFAVCKVKIIAGRNLTDLDAGMNNCILGEQISEELAKQGMINPVGEKILLLNNVFTIVGVAGRAAPSEMRPNDINDGIMVSFATQSAISYKDQVTGIVARIEPGRNPQTAIDQVKSFMNMAFPRITMQILSAEEIIAQMNRQMNMMTLLLGVIGSISLVVGGVGVMNVMLVSVTERRREIGIRRALGAQQEDIRWQFLLEALLLCSMGGVLGIGFGIGSSYAIAMHSQWQFMVSWWAVILGGGISVTSGVFFGLYPAIKAARLIPIDALRAS